MHTDVVRRVIIALACITILSALARRYLIDARDPYHCTALLNEGQWLTEPKGRHFQRWQTPKCLMHDYTGPDINHCAGGRPIYFAGDSNVRQLFWAIAKKLNHGKATDLSRATSSHDDVIFEERDMIMRFSWDPFLNGSSLATELAIYSENVGAGVGGKDRRKGSKDQDSIMIILGAGMFHSRYFGDGEAVREFRNSVDKITSFTQRNDGGAWKATSPFDGWEGIGDQVLMMPVEEPRYERLSPTRRETILPEEINQMNDYLRTLSSGKGLTIPWVHQVMTSKHRLAYEQSGIHVVEPIVNRRADVLLNLRCNAKVDNAVGTPYERTCCSKYTSGNWFQWVLLVVSLGALPVVNFMLPRSSVTVVPTSLYGVLYAFMIIGLALAYCFLADRSQLFTKASKTFHSSESLLLFGAALAMGMATLRKTKEGRARRTSTNDIFVSSTPTLLSREQTDEWKGWMQMMVLLYHCLDTQGRMPLYIMMRLTVASYLFVTAYGHTTYFLLQDDYSLQRVVKVLVRSNLFPVLLSYQMYNKYLLYMFPALATFWFLVVLITLSFGSELNDKTGFLLAKIAIATCLVMLSCAHAQPTDGIFRQLKILFGIDWNAGDFRKMVSLDCYIPFVGMLVALMHIWYQDSSSLSGSKDYTQGTRGRKILLLPKVMQYVKPAAITASLVAIPTFILLIGRSPDEADYNWWAAIISPVPILAYVVLRNSHPILRDHYSAGFAWLGACSAETWLLSFHVMRAADGQGILSIGLFSTGDGSLRSNRWKEVVLIVPILLWSAWQVSCAVRQVTAWFVERHGLEKRVLVLVMSLWLLNLATQ